MFANEHQIHAPSMNLKNQISFLVFIFYAVLMFDFIFANLCV